MELRERGLKIFVVQLLLAGVVAYGFATSLLLLMALASTTARPVTPNESDKAFLWSFELVLLAEVILTVLLVALWDAWHSQLEFDANHDPTWERTIVEFTFAATFAECLAFALWCWLNFVPHLPNLAGGPAFFASLFVLSGVGLASLVWTFRRSRELASASVTALALLNLYPCVDDVSFLFRPGLWLSLGGLAMVIWRKELVFRASAQPPAAVVA